MAHLPLKSLKRRLVLALALSGLALLPFENVLAAETPSGLPLPRFATTRSTPINVRVGPGTKYDVVWIYKLTGIPVEIIQEFDTWRKIRDYDGSEGWVHQNLLSGARAGIVGPAGQPGERFALRSAASEESGVNAWVGPGFPVKLSGCDGTWCRVTATDHPAGGHATTYSGYVEQSALWGVYQGEVFDN